MHVLFTVYCTVTVTSACYCFYSIVDSCNILMYAANSVIPLYLCTQPKLVRIFIYHVFKMQSILKRATKTLFNAKYQGHYVCAYTTLNYCVLSHVMIIVNSRAVSAVSALLVSELQHIRMTLQ